MACHKCGERNATAFHRFLANKLVLDENDILEWLGNTFCVLFIDELNNLRPLMDRNSAEASNLGAFLEENLIGKENQCLVFSSHLFVTLEFFAFLLMQAMPAPVLLCCRTFLWLTRQQKQQN